MDPDLLFVIGLGIFVLMIPTLLSAYTDGRVPRLAAILVLVSLTLVVVAVNRKPTGYTWDEVPRVVASVFGRYLN